jgi:hypothetical protein
MTKNKFTCRETQELILKLIAEGNIEKAKYIEGLRNQNIVVTVNEEPKEKKVNPYADSNQYWSDANYEIVVLLPEDPDDENEYRTTGL